jgi:hypothetical protein
MKRIALESPSLSRGAKFSLLEGGGGAGAVERPNRTRSLRQGAIERRLERFHPE